MQTFSLSPLLPASSLHPSHLTCNSSFNARVLFHSSLVLLFALAHLRCVSQGEYGQQCEQGTQPQGGRDQIQGR